MPFISPSHNLPAVATSIFEYLLDVGTDVPIHQLAETLSPPSLYGPAGKNEGEPGGYAVEHTISALIAAGIVRTDDKSSAIRLVPGLTNSKPKSGGTLRAILLRRVFKAGVADVWGTQNGQWNVSHGCTDAIRAATWFVSLDPLIGALGYGLSDKCTDAEQLQAQTLGTAGLPMVVSNATTWDNFVRWMTFLGLAISVPSRRGSYVQAEGSHAIGELLRDQLPSGEKVPIKRLIDTVSSAIPIVGAGAYAAELSTLMTATIPTPTAFVTHALLTLDSRQLIKLINEADAPESFTLSDGEDRKRVTHVISGDAV